MVGVLAVTVILFFRLQFHTQLSRPFMPGLDGLIASVCNVWKYISLAAKITIE